MRLNRREVILNTLCSSLFFSLGNPIALLGQQCPRPRLTLFIFFRGGSDGLDAFPLVPPSVRSQNSELWNFLTNDPNFNRSSILLPSEYTAERPYIQQEIIPINSSSQFGLHPAWERLRNVSPISVSGTYQKPARKGCDSVNGRPLDDYLIFRLMKGVGMLHFYGKLPQRGEPDPSTLLRNIRIDKSHFNTQLFALIGMINSATGVGFLGKSVFNSDFCSNAGDIRRYRLIGVGGFSRSELGSTVYRDILSLPGGFSDLSVTEPGGTLHLGYPYKGCANYQQVNTSSIMTSSATMTDVREILNNFRGSYTEGLKKAVVDAYQRGLEAHNMLSEIANIDLKLGSEDDDAVLDRFRGYVYSRNGNIWNIAPLNRTTITNHFMNITRFFLASQNGLDRIDKTVALSIGGFDTHAGQLTDLPNLIAQVAGGIHGMLTTIFHKNNQLFGNISIYIMTEFGRTIRANAALSTDHGWGNNLIAIFTRSQPMSANQRLDRELGPTFALTSDPSSVLNSRAFDFARNVERTFLNLNPFHIYPTVSMHTGLAEMLRRAFGISSWNGILDEEFWQVNFINENQRRLWSEFLADIPSWNE